jgi:hypothetical protein
VARWLPSIARNHGSISEVIGLLILSAFAVAISTGWLVSRFPPRAGMLAAWPALLAALFGDVLLTGTPPRRSARGGRSR